MIEIKDASANEAPKKRPTGLSILFVMTMISTGWQLLGFLAGVISRKPRQRILKMSNSNMLTL